jgi:hypothetical protein
MRTENKVSIDRMSDEDAGRLLKAILAHVAGEDVDDQDEPLAVQLMLPLITAQIDRADEKYQATVEKRRAAGALGGKAKHEKANDSNAKQSQAELGDAYHNDPVPVPDSDIKKKESPSGIRKKVFAPPTVEEVKEYVAEKQLRVDPERFVSFYASKNWYVGKNKMVDWKAAIRVWSSRERPAEDKPYDREKIDYSAITRDLFVNDLKGATG